MNSATFLMSNMSPQLPGFNRAGWKGLENRERRWATERREVWVFAGPLWEGDEIRFIGDRVPVPTHFWKVVYDAETQEAISFVLPHRDLRTSELHAFVECIDEIEVRSGLNLSRALPDDAEERLEQPHSSMWRHGGTRHEWCSKRRLNIICRLFSRSTRGYSHRRRSQHGLSVPGPLETERWRA